MKVTSPDASERSSFSQRRYPPTTGGASSPTGTRPAGRAKRRTVLCPATTRTFPERLRELLDQGLVDYVAMDIKNSPDKWAKTAGLSAGAANALFGKTLRSMSIIKLSGVDYEFRTTIVKGLHELSDMDGLGQLVRGAKRYYLQNFTDSEAILEGTWGSHDKETLLAMLEVIRKYVPGAELRGVD